MRQKIKSLQGPRRIDKGKKISQKLKKLPTIFPQTLFCRPRKRIRHSGTRASERAGGLFGVWYWSLVPDSPQISPRLVLHCTLYLGPSGVGWDSSRAYNLKIDTCCGFQFKIWLLHYTKQESVQCRGKNDI